MNVAWIIIIAIPLFYLAYRFYARYIARIFQEDDRNDTPAVSINDGVDYVPTKPLVLFGHHFSSIAGGGPIIGPTVGMIFGFIPVWLWVVLGSIFIGAVHDFAALFASVREKGRSMAEVAERTLGKSGFLLFIGFTIIMLLMVSSAFLGLTATALTSLVPLKVMGLESSQTLLKTELVEGVVNARIGGIASTSVIIITLFAPLLGFLLYRKGMSAVLAAIFAVIICLLSIHIGISYPVSIDPKWWMVILSFYTLVAAGIPVWIILQPRDFTNSFLLYGGIAALLVGTIAAGIKGVSFNAPAFNIAEGNQRLGLIFPILFITVACGAISGFHALVAGGTTSKQLSREGNAKRIAYGGMLMEAILALGVLIAVGCGFAFKDYMDIVFPTSPGVKSNPVLAFALGMGGLMHKGLSIPNYYGAIFGILLVEGFVVTTLDTSIRLNRYLFEELWMVVFKNPPKIFRTYIFNSFICVVLMFLLGYYNTFLLIWPVFGSANQLLAALTLIAITVWLIFKGRRYLFALLPAVFMMVTTLYSLVYLLGQKYLPGRNYMLISADLLLIILALGVVWLSVNVIRRRKVKPN
ncbi:MAG: carbon starvation protein A [Deltaproteobacteria bacterium]|nr:MAG: carbon starvation protein A [Deltaproteobacteria bacterium]